jgi:hypothetical protein
MLVEPGNRRWPDLCAQCEGRFGVSGGEVREDNNTDEPDDSLEIRFRLEKHGWSELLLHSLSGEYTIFISSVFSDPVTDLCDAISQIVHNSEHVEFILYEEPGGHRLSFDRSSKRNDFYQITVELLESTVGHVPKIGKTRFTTLARREDIAVQLFHELLRLRHLLTFDWYSRERRGEFNEDAFQRLTEKLRVLPKGKWASSIGILGR